MAILKDKPNVLDVLICIILVLLVTFAFVALTYRPKSYERTVRTTMISNRYSVDRTDQIVEQAKKRIGKNVYFDSTPSPVKLVGVEREERAEETNVVVLVLESRGEVNEERAVFNGLRIYVGQKSEVHSLFVVKGLISKIEYAN